MLASGGIKTSQNNLWIKSGSWRSGRERGRLPPCSTAAWVYQRRSDSVLSFSSRAIL